MGVGPPYAEDRAARHTTAKQELTKCSLVKYTGHLCAPHHLNLCQCPSNSFPSHTQMHAQELTKCSLVKYNPTGHLIAVVGAGARAASSSAANTDVYIFSTLTRRRLAVLRGHYTSIVDMSWSEDGLYLCSVSEGAVYTWHMETFTKWVCGLLLASNVARGCVCMHLRA